MTPAAIQYRIKKYTHPDNACPYVVQHRRGWFWWDDYQGHATIERAQERLWGLREWDCICCEPFAAPAPTITPSRSIVWWLWIVIAWPRRILSRFYHRSGMLPVYNRRTGASEYRRWRSALREWLWLGDCHVRWFRLWVRKFLEMRFCCPRCGHESFSGYGENDSEYPCHFELLETWSVGTEDGTDHRYRGWEFCARCGYREIVEEGSL
jgi:hypothetical protein